jgi:hypothetical protein
MIERNVVYNSISLLNQCFFLTKLESNVKITHYHTSLKIVLQRKTCFLTMSIKLLSFSVFWTSKGGGTRW